MAERKETKEELVVFVKEMLQQRPSRQMLKIYVIGSTLALLGGIAGLIQSVFTTEEEEEEQLAAGERHKEQERLRDRGTGQGMVTAVRTEEEEAPGQSTVPEEAKGDDQWRDLRRSAANRLHAS